MREAWEARWSVPNRLSQSSDVWKGRSEMNGGLGQEALMSN